MENKEIRRKNLADLLSRHLEENPESNRAKFAELCGLVPAQLSQLLGNKSFRNIGDALARRVEAALELNHGWMDSLHDVVQQNSELEFAGPIRSGYVPVMGEAILGIGGSVDMIEFQAGWLRVYSGDKDAYGLKVKGDSMWPRIQSGEFVVIEPNTAVRAGDEVFVRTKEGHNMIKIMNKTRDGNYKFSSVNNDHRPETLTPGDVETMHFVAAIVKPTRYIAYEDISVDENRLA
ncbi:helix-turn-helix transcriptional regulator [Erwinia endophytica]|uniref:S24 family peptidase n=1 Tax=Erwinia endophytica TaxID=1563158 RepID=UPI001265E971|nr:S24 family peptidase [Erwinia endophytica]KAB8312962.1 helix-turn-helix transcriptional regulator [Erwinia endophytica]